MNAVNMLSSQKVLGKNSHKKFENEPKQPLFHFHFTSVNPCLVVVAVVSQLS